MGRPKTATTDDNIAHVHQMVLGNRRIKVREIAEAMNMSKERVCWILKEDLGMRKLTARWVPRLLTLDQKRVRLNICTALLAKFRRNKLNFWRRLITVDETWIHHATPESKIQSKQWTAKGESAPRKAKIVAFLWRRTLSIIWTGWRGGSIAGKSV